MSGVVPTLFCTTHGPLATAGMSLNRALRNLASLLSMNFPAPGADPPPWSSAASSRHSPCDTHRATLELGQTVRRGAQSTEERSMGLEHTK